MKCRLGLFSVAGMVALVGLVEWGCGEGTGGISAKLQPLTGCGEVEAAIRGGALDEMNRKLDDALENALKNKGGCYWSHGDDRDYAAGAPSPAPSAAGGGTQSESNKSGATQASGTNNQVLGVEEADFVKNDKKYVYIVSGKHLRIIEAWPPPTSRELAKVEVEGTPRKLFVTDNRALVYSSLSKTSSKYYKECTYGYSCSFTGDGNPTLITVFDIKDRSNPKKVREVRLSGSYVNARQVGSAAFTVLSSPGVSFPDLSYYPNGLYDDCADNPPGWWQIIQAFEELRVANTTSIMKASMKDWLPSVEDTVLVGANAGTKTDLLVGCKGFYRSSIGDGEQFTTVLSLDIDNEQAAGASTIVSRPGAVYASGSALYISVPHQQQSGYRWYSSMSGVKEASTVHKFGLDPKDAKARYMASGVVKGRVLNQFSMDEHKGYLRMATTTGRVPNPNVHSTLTVLLQRGDVMVPTGKLDNLAPTEDIRSARFAGDRAYVVTFKKTDPLFVFDLSNPYNPQNKAELKIPGFSTYMHMMDDSHLMTIGYDADDQGSFAWFTGVMFQIFDVTDMTNPKRIHKEVIGTRGSSSAALNNHLAFNYFAPLNLLAIPMTVCEGGSGGGSYGNTMTFSGLIVYDVTTSGGFKLRGKVPHPTGKDIGCHNWWTNAESQVERSIIMADNTNSYVFSVSRELIKVNHLDDLAKDLVSLPVAD